MTTGEKKDEEGEQEEKQQTTITTTWLQKIKNKRCTQINIGALFQDVWVWNIEYLIQDSRVSAVVHKSLCTGPLTHDKRVRSSPLDWDSSSTLSCIIKVSWEYGLVIVSWWRTPMLSFRLCIISVPHWHMRMTASSMTFCAENIRGLFCLVEKNVKY